MQKSIYVSDEDGPLFERAEQHGGSLSSVIVTALREFFERIDGPPGLTIELYWTDALPEHYVARDSEGGQWLIPCVPMSPEAWEKRKPYRGNYELQRVAPLNIERFFQPRNTAAGAKEAGEGE